MRQRFVESPADDVELLFARQFDEVDRVARHANRQLRILLRMIHGVLQRLASEHVDVDVLAAFAEVTIEQADVDLAPRRMR